MTHAAFYVGWPKAWAAFSVAKEVWCENKESDGKMENYAKSIIFPIGKPNSAYADFFIGKSYIAPVSDKQVGIFNVTFEPGCRNNWHIHHGKNGGGQILICVGGRGYYQQWGEDAIEMLPGDVVNIPA